MNSDIIDRLLLSKLEKHIYEVIEYHEFDPYDNRTRDSIASIVDAELWGFVFEHKIYDYTFVLHDDNQLSLDISVVPNLSTSIININFKYESTCECDILPDNLFEMEK